MTSEDFPNDFDIVVLGTGLTETITAASFSRIGFKVLHLDRNDYYGGVYSNFNLEGIESWRLNNEKNINCVKNNSESDNKENFTNLLQEGESTIILPEETLSAFNIKCQFHIRQRTVEELAKVDSSGPKIITANESDEKPSNASASLSTEELPYLSEINTCTEQLGQTHITPSSNDSNTLMSDVLKNSVISEPPETKACFVEAVNKESEITENHKDWTYEDIKNDWRKYCLDVTPKMLYCSGELVELLIQSDVARYCEFRSVSRVLTFLNDTLQQVPCSRADVFSSKIVSLIEKRLMMKFLQFAADYESSPQEYQDYLDKPFLDFLKSKKLTPNIQHYIQHAIAMVTDSELTQVGLLKTKKFLQSLGRYGNTAFLFPLYGTGELPQAFSRLSAVFGGIYCLNTTATHLITNSDNKCCAIITSRGQRVSCKYVVAECSYLPASYVQILSNSKISRAILITDSSIMSSENSELSLLNYVSTQDAHRPVTVVELPSTACVCPKDTYIVHMTKNTVENDPEKDFKEVRDKLFASGEEKDTKKPKILWSMYFNQDDCTQIKQRDNAPSNVMTTAGGGNSGIDLDYCVAEAKNIFHTVCPSEEFLPKPPNPEDIILVDDTEASTEQATPEYQAGQEDNQPDFSNTRSEDSIQGDEATQTAAVQLNDS